MKTITEYAIINAPIEIATENNHDVRFESQDLDEILFQLTEMGGDDSDTSIEIYAVDEDGEFVDGSDFDTVSNFLKRYGREDAAEKARLEGIVGRMDYALGICVRDVFLCEGGWQNAKQSDIDDLGEWLQRHDAPEWNGEYYAFEFDGTTFEIFQQEEGWGIRA